MELHISRMIQVILRLDDESLSRMSCSLLYSSHKSQSRRAASSNLPALSKKRCGSYFPMQSSYSVSYHTVFLCLSRSVSARDVQLTTMYFPLRLSYSVSYATVSSRCSTYVSINCCSTLVSIHCLQWMYTSALPSSRVRKPKPLPLDRVFADPVFDLATQTERAPVAMYFAIPGVWASPSKADFGLW